MNLSTEQLAELLAGIARSQQAIIDAIDSESGGWRNTHLLPKLTVAANLRLAHVRLLDLPSRILLRSQARTPMDPPRSYARWKKCWVAPQRLRPPLPHQPPHLPLPATISISPAPNNQRKAARNESSRVAIPINIYRRVRVTLPDG